MRASLVIPFALVAGAAARAEPTTPTHAGESGTLDVPNADTLGRAGATFMLDLRYLQSADTGRSFGPSPLVMSFGLGRFETGLSLRQGGLPGDPRPASTIPAAAGKFSILQAKGKRPALAVDLFIDRINRNQVFHLRGIASTERRWRTRLSAFGGGVLGIDKPNGWTAGLGLSVLGPRHTEFLGEILRQPMGALAGLGIHWQPVPQFALGAGVSYLPDDARTWVVGLSIAFSNPALARAAAAAESEKPQEESKAKTGKHGFRTDRPRFPLELRSRPLPGESGGPARHYPGGGTVAALPPPAEPSSPKPEASPPPSAAAPGPSTIPVPRGNQIVQRPVIASVLIVPPKPRVPLPNADRQAIKQLALRAAKGEGELAVVAPTPDPAQKKPSALIGRAVGIKRLAAKFARLKAAKVAIEVAAPEIVAPGRILLALLAPEGAAPPPPAGGKPSAVEPPAAGGSAVPAPPPATTPSQPEPAAEPPSPPAPATVDAGVAAPASSPDAGTSPGAGPRPDANPDGSAAPDASAADLAADTRSDTTPERIERLVPLPPTLKQGAAAEDQVGQAIATFQPALKECVNRALKRDPGLRGEAVITLDIQSTGRVKLNRIKSKTLAGGWFESCVARAAEQWRMPRTPQGYRVEIPLKIHIANGGSP